MDDYNSINYKHILEREMVLTGADKQKRDQENHILKNHTC